MNNQPPELNTPKKGCDIQPPLFEPFYTFGMVIEVLKESPEKRAYRKHWKEQGVFIVIMPALNLPPFSTGNTNRKVNDRTAKHIGEDTPLNSKPYFALGKTNGDWQPGWTPGQEDMFEEDWLIK